MFNNTSDFVEGHIIKRHPPHTAGAAFYNKDKKSRKKRIEGNH